VDRDELEREQNIEELRRFALAQQAQIQQLLEIISRKSRVIDKLRGTSGDLQLTLKLLAELRKHSPRLRPSRRPSESRHPRRGRRRSRSCR